MFEKFIEENISVIIAIIPGIVASTALYLNKKTHDKEIRNQNYVITEKLDQEYQKVESRIGEIIIAEKEAKESKEILDTKRAIYEWDFIRFFTKIAYLTDNKLIPIHTAVFYHYDMGLALGFIERHPNKEKLKPGYDILLNYCSKNNIQSRFS